MNLTVARLSALACAALVDSSPARAQEAPLDEVVVTATKREAQLIDVPIAVTALGAEKLQNSGVSDIRELTSLAPSMQFQTPGADSDTSIRIRGIGTTSTNPGLESSVGVVIDGVARARTGVALTELGDLERIEVLRGPQGTLFGRNTSSGLINIVTQEPSLRGIKGRLEGTIGAHENMRVGGSLNVPLSSQSALRVEASAETRDGFYENRNGNEEMDDIDRQFVRAKLRWEAARNLSWLFSADFINRDESCCVALLRRAGSTYDTINTLARARGEFGYTSTNPFDRQAVTTQARLNQEDVTDWGVSAQGELDLGWSQLTSITAWRRWELWRSQDFDHSGADLGFVAKDGLHQGFDVFTQELRLQGNSGPIDWLIGAFYSFEEALYDTAFRMGADYPLLFGGAATFQPTTLAAFTPGDGARGVGQQDGSDVSIFAHNIFRVSDALSVTGGLRYTYNQKSVRYYGESFNPACDRAVINSDAAGITRFCAAFWDTRLDPAGDSDSRAEDAITGTFNIAYEFVPQVRAYLSYARGYKSGGYNFDRAGFRTPARPDARDLAFRMETVDAYEAGVKTRSVEGDFTANFAVFRQQFSGLQFIENTGVGLVVRSLAEVITQGAEIEMAWRPLDGLIFTNGLSYTDAYYTPNAGNLVYSGQEMEQSPDWVNVTSLTWNVSLGETLTGVVYLDNRYSSAYFTSGFEPARVQRSFSVTNARLAVRAGAWSVDLWSRNLFDTDYLRRVFPATFQPGSYSAYLGDPSTYGITVRRDF